MPVSSNLIVAIQLIIFYSSVDAFFTMVVSTAFARSCFVKSVLPDHFHMTTCYSQIFTAQRIDKAVTENYSLISRLTKEGGERLHSPGNGSVCAPPCMKHVGRGPDIAA